MQKLMSTKFKREEAYLKYGDSPRHEAKDVADVIGEDDVRGNDELTEEEREILRMGVNGRDFKNVEG